jgi:hypothetical protein
MTEKDFKEAQELFQERSRLMNSIAWLNRGDIAKISFSSDGFVKDHVTHTFFTDGSSSLDKDLKIIGYNREGMKEDAKLAYSYFFDAVRTIMKREIKRLEFRLQELGIQVDYAIDKRLP